MRHGDGNPDPLRQLQQVCFPGPGATAIAATAIGANQQTSGRTIALSPIQPPPPPDTLHREFRRVVADPYVDHGPIVPDIIDPIGNGLALAPGRPIMHIDFVGLPFGSPRATPIFKGSYELFFLRISEMLR